MLHFNTLAESWYKAYPMLVCIDIVLLTHPCRECRHRASGGPKAYRSICQGLLPQSSCTTYSITCCQPSEKVLFTRCNLQVLSSWLSRLECRHRACVVRNVTSLYSVPSLLYQFALFFCLARYCPVETGN